MDDRDLLLDYARRRSSAEQQALWASDVRAVLSPAQQAADDELKAEHDASTARARLPKS